MFRAPHWVGLSNFYDLVGFHLRRNGLARFFHIRICGAWLLVGKRCLRWNEKRSRFVPGIVVVLAFLIGTGGLLLSAFEPVMDAFWYFVATLSIC